MAITTAMCTSFRAEVLQGIHSSADVYKIALYTSSATLDATTTADTTTNEISGTGYTAGGATLSGFNVVTSGTTAILDFDNASWANATLTARGAMIYNSTKSNKAVAVWNFGADKTSTDGTFTANMPTPDATNGLIKIKD